MRPFKPSCAGVVIAASLACTSLAYSQRALTITPKGSQQSFSEDELYKRNGKNIIYFMNGFSCIAGDEYDYFGQSPAPHYILNNPGRSGRWDITVDSYKKIDCSRTMTEDAGNTLYYRMFDLRKRGYKNIVLGGQSLGAWAATIAAKNSDLQADALLLLVPARWGRRELRGSYNPNFFKNKTGYLDILNQIRIPAVLVFFDKDDFDPGGRAEEAEDILHRNNVAHVIINNPKGFSGHGAGWLPAFDYEFEECIEKFLIKKESASCNERPLSDDDFRSIVDFKQILEQKVPAENNDYLNSMIGKKYIVYLSNGGSEEETFLDDGTISAFSSFGGQSTRPYRFEDGKYCWDDKVQHICRLVVAWSPKQALMFDDKSGKTTSWWIEEDKR